MIALIALFTGALGTIFILYRKTPKLLEFDDAEIAHLNAAQKISGIKTKVLHLNSWKDFVIIDFLEKLLLKIRILILKTDNKIIGLVEKVRVDYKKQKPNPVFSPDYWEKIKALGQKKKAKIEGKKIEIAAPEKKKAEEIKTRLPDLEK